MYAVKTDVMFDYDSIEGRIVDTPLRGLTLKTETANILSNGRTVNDNTADEQSQEEELRAATRRYKQNINSDLPGVADRVN